MNEPTTSLEAALDSLTSGVFVMTSFHEDKRTGVLVRSVQSCANEPLLICVAARKGHWIEPVIRDSRVFAVCQLGDNDLLARRRFAHDLTEEEQGDPFTGMDVRTLETGAPVLNTCVLAMDCEVVRHFDLEADHELYIGLVVASTIKPVK